LVARVESNRQHYGFFDHAHFRGKLFSLALAFACPKGALYEAKIDEIPTIEPEKFGT
jgi:hypothetical protein